MEATAAGASSDASAAVAHETSLFESFTAIPFVAGATLVPDPENDTLTLYVTTAQRDLASDGLRRSVAAVPLPASLTSEQTKDSPENRLEKPGVSSLRHPSFGIEERGVLLSSVSPSGRKRLVARDANAAGGDRGSGIAFEVWEEGALVSETLVPPSTHGSLCVDGTFGGVSWSALETRVAYVAEAPESEDRTPEWGMGVTSDAKTKAKKLPLPEDGEEDTKETEENVSEDQKDTSTKKRGWRGRGEWREDWGEQLVGKIKPSLYVLETESCSITEPRGLPGDAVVASGPAWAPVAFGKESDQIVCAAWLGDIKNFKSTSRRLGLVFCFNRPSALFLVSAPLPERAKTELNADANESAVLLTKDVPSALWPRFSPDGKNLAYVSHERAVVTGAHATTCTLRVMDWTKEGKPSRDVLGVETKKKRGAFPGLYASAPLVADPWLGNDALVVQTTWGAGEAIVRVDVNSGEVTRLTPPAAEGEGDWIGGLGSRKGDEEKDETNLPKRKPFSEPGGSWALADVKRGVVAAVRSDPGSPPEARVCFIGESSLETRASFAGWHAVTRSVASPAARQAAAALEKLEYFAQDVSRSVSDGAYLLTSADADGDDAFGDATVVQSIVVRVKRDDTSPTLTDTDDKKKPPLIILPHGGPHGACTAMYVTSVAYLASLGYAVAYCNYRGSTGYGESALQSLVGGAGGGAGVRDVMDCSAIARRCINDGICDPDRVCVVGGSHGGFLGGHLVGQKAVLETFGVDFKCAVLRNPVTDIGAMTASTDIPDWCFVETLGIDAYTDDPSIETLAHMRSKSPIAHVEEVARKGAPVMMLIGAVDKRVPPTNGLRYAAALRAAGGTCHVRVFPEDAHGLVKPRTEFESFVTVAAFLRETLGA
jgi:acylaminoacyl-peptidase